MKCHFFSKEKCPGENLLLASLSMGESFCKASWRNSGFSVMFIPGEIFLWLQKHFEGSVEFEIPLFHGKPGHDPRASSLSCWLSCLGGGTMPRTRSGSRAGAWWGMKEVKVKQ